MAAAVPAVRTDKDGVSAEPYLKAEDTAQADAESSGSASGQFDFKAQLRAKYAPTMTLKAPVGKAYVESFTLVV